MSEPFLAEINMFGGNFAPRGWAFCDGQLLPIAQNDALFSILGTLYGGDGRTTFGLPDLRGRSPKHPGDGPGLRQVRLGERGGREEHTMTTAEMPSHSHTGSMYAEGGPATANIPLGRLFAKPKTDDLIYADAAPRPNKLMHDDCIKVNASGGGQSFSIDSPYLGVNFIIALQGVYPSRS